MDLILQQAYLFLLMSEFFLELLDDFNLLKNASFGVFNLVEFGLESINLLLFFFSEGLHGCL